MLLNLCIHVLHLIAHLSPQNNGHPPNIGEEEMDNLIWDQAKWKEYELYRNKKERKKECYTIDNKYLKFAD